MYFDLKTGYSCNNRCVHCVIEPERLVFEVEARRHDATTDELLAQIDVALAKGCTTLVLTGGEVTLRSDFLHLVGVALGKGLRVAVQTNGRTMTALVEKLPHAPDRLLFAVAVHGPCSAVHDRVTNRDGSFAQTVGGIRALVAHGHRVVGKLVLSRYNLGQALATLELLGSEGVSRFIVAFPHAAGFSRQAMLAVVPRYGEVVTDLEQCACAAPSRGWSVEFETVPCCVVAAAPAVWLRSRDLRVAVAERVEGFIRAPGVGELTEWETERRRMKWRGDACRKCLLAGACEGPWAEYVGTFGDGEFRAFEDPAVLEGIVS